MQPTGSPRRRRTVMRPRERAGGFTLLEVMVAMTLLAIGVLSLAALQLLVMEYGARGRHLTEAAAIAQSHMERLQRLRWSEGLLQPTGGAWSLIQVEDVEVQVDGGTATRQSFEVYRRVANAVTDVTRTVDVRVDWDEPNRPNRSYALSSLRYNVEGL